MESKETSLASLYAAVPQMETWIRENKPNPSKAKEVFQQFIARWGDKIVGNEAFVQETQRVIENASWFATGAKILERLTNSRGDMIVQEGKKNKFDPNATNHSEPPTINLNFSSNDKGSYVCTNRQGERDFSFSPREVTLIHEFLHAWHYFENPQIEQERYKDVKVLMPEMDNREEELTITGDLHNREADSIDYCCENTALLECGLPLHINHRGLSKPCMHDFVRNRILYKICERSADVESLSEKNEDVTPLEMAIILYILEKDSRLQQDWREVILLLVETGSLSDFALQMAVLLNAEELFLPMLAAGGKLSDNVLFDANKEHPARVKVLWEELAKRKWVMSDEKIEELCNKPWVVKKGQENPIEKMFDKQKQQRNAIKAQCRDEDALPIHKIKDAAYANSIPGKNEVKQWLDRYYVRKIKKSVTENPTSVAMAPYGGNQSAAREMGSDGQCRLSFAYMSCFAVCYKPRDKVAEGPFARRPYFSWSEVEAFINSLSIRDIDRLAGSMSRTIMENLGLGYAIKSTKTHLPDHNFPMAITINKVNQDDEFHSVLCRHATQKITNAFAQPDSLVAEGKLEQRYSLEICLFSEEGNGLLQQLKENCGGRYSDSIATLKAKDGEIVVHSVLRFMLKEHLLMDDYRLHFGCEMEVNGKVISEMGYG